MTNNDDQTAIEDRLRRLWRRELADARKYRPEMRGNTRRSMLAASFSVASLALLMGLLAVLVSSRPTVVPGKSPTPADRMSPSAAASGETPSATVVPSVEGSPIVTRLPTRTAELGVLSDGIPASLDGVPVLRGVELRNRIAASPDSATFLAGGWLQLYSPTRSCPYLRPDPAVDRCLSFGLFDQPYQGVVIWISRGDPGLFTPALVEATRAAVLEIHTHDTSCTPDFEGCERWPVLSGVRWLSSSGPPSPGPTATPPISPLTRADAIARAVAQGPAGASVRSLAVELETQAVPEEWPREFDPWVWAVVLETGKGGTELVLLDYLTGEFIESITPAA